MKKSAVKRHPRDTQTRAIKRGSKLWAKEPLCEVCGREVAYSFSLIPEGKKHTWKFTGDCTADTEKYYIDFKRCFRSMAAFVDALAHISEKTYFDPADFFRMLHRFRKATGSYQKFM